MCKQNYLAFLEPTHNLVLYKDVSSLDTKWRHGQKFEDPPCPNSQYIGTLTGTKTPEQKQAGQKVKPGGRTQAQVGHVLKIF